MVEEETGVAIPSARVVLLASSAVIADTPFVVQEWRADARGVVAAQLSGRGALQATAEGHVWSAAAEGAELAEPVVTLRCRRGALVQGTVVDAKGAALAEVEVSAENTSLRAPGDRPPRATFDRTRTDAQGRFRTWVLDGEALVRAGSGLWKVTEQEVAVPTAALRLVLEPGFAVRGQVLGADGGEAAFAEVEYGGVRPAAADAVGRFELGALEDPKLTLVASSDDGAERSSALELSLRRGAWTEVQLHLRPTLRVEGVVKDAAGRPVPGAFLAAEPVGGDDDALAMPVADWTGGSELRSGPGGEFSFDTGGLDPSVTVEVLGWARGAQGSVRARAGQRAELVLRETPMVTGAVAGPDGRALSRFLLSGARVDSPDGTFAVARDVLGDQLAAAAEGHQTALVPLPDGGADLGRISLAQVHRVHLELTVDGHRPRHVSVDGERLWPEPDGGLGFEARLPSQVVWLHGVEFVSRRVEVGANDHLLRLELSSGGKLLVRTPAADRAATQFALEDCVPPRAPVDRQRRAVAEDGGWLLSGLTAGRCRLALEDPQWDGSVVVDLPGEGLAEVAMPVTPRPVLPGQMVFPHLRGAPPGRPHQRIVPRATP